MSAPFLSTTLAIQLALLVPLIGAVLIVAAGRWPNLRETVTMLTAVTLFAVVIRVLLGLLDGEVVEVALVTDMLPGLSLALHTEPLSILFALLASGLWIVTSVYSIGYMRGNHEKHQTRFYAWFAVSLCGAMGVAFSANLLTLFVFYEVLTLSTWPLVTHKGDDNARAGGRIYLGVLLFTSIALLLPAIIWTYAVAGTLDFRPGGILEGKIAGGAATLLLFLFVLGIGKAAVMPMHRWLPAAMVAPTPVSALLHAVAVVKAGVFTLIKVVVYIFGTDFLFRVPNESLAIYLAGFTVVAASLVALKQTNIKRMLAYSTIAHVGFFLLGMISGTPAGYAGSMFYILIYAMMSLGSFGMIILLGRKGMEADRLDDFRGLARRSPWYAFIMMILMFSMAGVPPLAGFWSKWFVIKEVIASGNVLLAAIAVIFSVIGAFYYLRIVKLMYFDEPENMLAFKASQQMRFVLSLNGLLVLVVGLIPGTLMALCLRVLGAG